MYRVYDKKRKHWLKEENIYLSADGYLYLAKKDILDWFNHIVLLFDDDRYIIHRDIGLYDKDNLLIYEGDYVKCQVSEDRTVYGLVAFSHELAAYIILCDDSHEWFSLSSDISEFIEIVGNVFDGYESEKQDGESAL